MACPEDCKNLLKSGVVILARTDSSRLPSKSLRRLVDSPVIEHQMKRLRGARRPQMFVLATTNRSVDDDLCAVAAKSGFHIFRGNPYDVVLRLRDAACNMGIDLMLVAGGDDVFCAPELVDQLVEAYMSESYDFATVRGAVFGVSPFAVTRDAIERLIEIRADTNTDGWERYFTETGLFKFREFPPAHEYLCHPEFRLDLDYPEDLALIEAIYNELYKPGGEEPPLKSVVQLLLRKPNLATINRSAHIKWLENRDKTWPPLQVRVKNTVADGIEDITS